MPRTIQVHTSRRLEGTLGGCRCNLNGVHATLCFEFSFFNFLSHFCFCYKDCQGLQACRSEPVLIAGTGRCYRSTAVYTAVLQYLYHQYYYYAVQHVSQAPPGRAKCPADPHARRRPKRHARGRRPGAGRRRAWGSRGHFGGRCCLTAGATTDHSPDASRLRHPGTSNKVQ